MSKNKKRNKESNSSLLINLLKIKNPYLAVNKLKFEFNRKDVEKKFSKLISNNLYKRYINDVTFPREYENIESREILPKKGTLDQELWWNLIVVCQYHKELTQFNILYNKYFNLFFYGYFEQAMECLYEIEQQFGLSYWLIENRIILLSKENGLKEQKKYVEDIREILPPTTALLVFYMSLKVESEVSYEQFNRIFYKLWEEYPEIKNYFFIKCNPLSLKVEKLEDVVHFEGHSSIIDRYLALKKLFFIILSDDSKYNLSLESLKKYISKLNNCIEDNELKSLVYSLNIQDFDKLYVKNEKYVNALDLYTEGRYKESHLLCKELLDNNSEYWLNIIELLIKCEIRNNDIVEYEFNDNSIIKFIYYCAKSILLKDDDLIISTKKLLKIALELSSNSISNKIVLFIHRQIPFFTPFPIINFVNEAKLYSVSYDIRNRDLFDIKIRNNLIKQFNINYENSSTYQLISFNAINKKIPDYRRDKYRIEEENSLINDENKIIMYNKIINTCNILDRYYAMIQLSNLYFKSNKIEKSIECIVDSYLENVNLIYSLPIKEVIEYIAEVHKFDFDDNISTSILYDLYSRYISSNLDEVKAIRCEIFLEKNGYLKPTDLIENFSKHDAKKVNYYLEYICTMKTLDSFITFSSSEEVENERINICQFLVKNKGIDDKKLLKEIKNISESSLISKFIIEIEQNKIYVNIEGIKEKLNPILDEYYQRYKKLVHNVDDLRLKLRSQYIINMEYKKNEPYPKNDIMPLLFHALLETKEYFVFSSEYGLAGFLSTNIRHGKLYNFLSSSLLSSNLIIKNENAYWQNYYKNGEDISNLILYLQAFTSGVDEVINNFINRYIQIKTLDEEKKHALFDYNFKEHVTIPLYIDLEEDPTFEDFQNRLLELFWLKTERNLINIREKISNELSIELNNEFEILNKNLENLKDKLNISHIRDLIKNERITMQRKMENLLLWFTRQTSSNVSDFNFNLANDITREVITNVHVNHVLDINLEIKCGEKFHGFMLKGLVDILFILYDNAINNYKKKENKDLNKYFFLSFESSYEEKFPFKLSARNYINKNTNLDLLDQKLEEIKENIRTKMYGKRVASEGGTGFYKIVKILRYDLNLLNKFYLDFYLDKENYMFIVDIYFRRI